MTNPEALSSADAHYDAEFFRRQSSGSLRSARVILKLAFDWLRPRHVVDVGCGIGTWLVAAKEFGAESVLGIDGSHVDRSELQVDSSEFVERDLEQESVRTVVADDRRFDLVICMEVAEHLTYRRARSFVEDLVALGDSILFSAAVPYQAGTNHINEQWPEYWALLFECQGYSCVDAIRDRVWYDDDVDWWYRQNALLFVKHGSPSAAQLAAAPIGPLGRPPVSRVHPYNLLFQVLNTFRTYRSSARDEEVADTAAIFGAFDAGETTLPPFRAIARAEADPAARDVFPATRMVVCEPEEEARAAKRALTWQQQQSRDLQGLLDQRQQDLDITRELLTQRAGELEATRELLELRHTQLEETRALLTARQDTLDATQRLLSDRSVQVDVSMENLRVREEELETCRRDLAAARLHLRRVPRIIRRVLGIRKIPG